MFKPSFLKLPLVFAAVFIARQCHIRTSHRFLFETSVSQVSDWRLETIGRGFFATALRFTPLPERRKRITHAFLFSLFWVTISLFIVSSLWMVYWTIGYWSGLDAPSISWSSWWSFLVDLSEFGPILFIGVIAPVLLLGFLTALFRPCAKVMLFAVSIISLLLSAGVFYIFNLPYGTGYEYEGVGWGRAIALIIELLVIFIAIAVLPIAWIHLRTEESNLRALVAHSLLPGLLVILLFSTLFFVSTYPSLLK